LQGLQLLEAPNGVLGLKLIREHATELTGVLLDLTMPGMSGHEVF
jgi:CheY-like chemotaxis protein